MTATIIEMLTNSIILAALLWASATDMRERVIPNACVTAVVAAFVLRTLAAPGAQGALHGLAVGFAHACLVFSLLLLSIAFMSRLGNRDGIGAGDIKLLSALATTMPVLGGITLIGLSCALGLCGHAAFSAASMARQGKQLRSGLRMASPATALRLDAPAREGEGIRMAPAIAAAYLLLQLWPAAML